VFRLTVTFRRPLDAGDVWVIGDYEGNDYPQIGDLVEVITTSGSHIARVSGAGFVHTTPRQEGVRGIVLKDVSAADVPLGAVLEWNMSGTRGRR
jgi:hypothetical protein